MVALELARQIQRVKTTGLSIPFAEKNSHFTTEISDRTCGIEKGRIRFQGSTKDFAASKALKQKCQLIQRLGASVLGQFASDS